MGTVADNIGTGTFGGYWNMPAFPQAFLVGATTFALPRGTDFHTALQAFEHPAPRPSSLLTGEEFAASVLQRGTVKGLTDSELQLLQWELEHRAAINPADDFARLMLADVKKRRGGKVVGRVRKKIAAKVGKKVLVRLAEFMPGLGLLAGVYDAASTAAEVLEAVQLAAMERALGPQTMAARQRTTPTPGPRTRYRNRPTPERPVAPKRRTAPQLQDPGALTVNEPQPVVELQPLDTGPNPMIDQVPPSQPAPGPKRATDKPPQIDRRLRDAIQPRTQTQRLIDQIARPGAAASAAPGPSPLTRTEPQGVPCDCPKGTRQREKRKPRKPREVCYRGTYTERRKGLSKHRREKIACQ